MLIKEFRYVLAIAECGTVSQAAEKLYISQPALTKYVHNLEDNLNIKLFEKVGRTMQLTSYGRSYVEAARKIVGICDELEQEVYASDEMLRGTLRVGCSHRGAYILPHVLPDFFTQFPAVDFTLSETSYEEVERLLMKGDIDIGILKEPSMVNDNSLVYVPLFEEELVLVSSINNPLNRFAEVPHPDGSYRWIDIRHFANENFVLYRAGHRNRILIDALMLRSGIQPKHFFDTNHIEGAIHLVQNGFGVCFSPEVYANNMLRIDRDIPSIALFSVGDPVPKYRYYIAYRKGTSMTRYAARFIELLSRFYRGE